MSRTKRIYNSKRWKWFNQRERYVCICNNIKGEKQIVYSDIFPYHPYAQMCMGNCPRCSIGKARERRHQRRQLRMEEKHYDNF